MSRIFSIFLSVFSSHARLNISSKIMLISIKLVESEAKDKSVRDCDLRVTRVTPNALFFLFFFVCVFLFLFFPRSRQLASLIDPRVGTKLVHSHSHELGRAVVFSLARINLISSLVDATLCRKRAVTHLRRIDIYKEVMETKGRMQAVEKLRSRKQSEGGAERARKREGSKSCCFGRKSRPLCSVAAAERSMT